MYLPLVQLWGDPLQIIGSKRLISKFSTDHNVSKRRCRSATVLLSGNLRRFQVKLIILHIDCVTNMEGEWLKLDLAFFFIDKRVNQSTGFMEGHTSRMDKRKS